MFGAEDNSSSLEGLTFDQIIRKVYPPGPIYNTHSEKLNTKSEQRIRYTSSGLRSKPGWITKVTDATIRSRWAAEAYAQGLTEKEVDYVFAELAYYSSLHVPNSGIFLSAVEQVWISDTLIDDETEQVLRKWVAVLESGPEDWHPRNEGVVHNLIHPSLFPLIYGRSSFVDKKIESPVAVLHVKSFGRFCWLPSEFQVHQNGHVTVESYINNLHPLKYAEFYPVIGNVFSKFVPVLEQVVTDLAHRREQCVVPAPYAWFDDSDEPKDYDAEDYYEKYDLWQETRPFIEPQPEPFQWPDRPAMPYNLKGRRLQAIVKMSNIILTPENPVYEGGAWHVEALANERIIATGLYYYDVDNITESNLAFREM
ncbi:hypothetical protein LPJ66_002667, partial [Kickxella alabastrina]